MFKVNDKNTRAWSRSGVFTVNYKHISHLFLVSSVSIADFEQVNVSRADTSFKDNVSIQKK